MEKRQIKTLSQYREEYKKYYFDKYAGDRAVAYFERELTHAKGIYAGQKFYLEIWQVKLIRRIYGWKNRETHLRKYRVVYLEIPRKNGKSFFGSGVASYGLFADGELGAEVISAAAESDQAAIIFDTAKTQIENNPKLSKLCKTYRRAIHVPSTNSVYKVVSSDAHSKHGYNTHVALIDELHAHKNRELIDVIRTGMLARSQPLLFIATTAGFDRNSICWEYHEYAIKVRDGLISDEHFLPVIYAADPEDDWTSPVTWHKANPNIGVTFSEEDLAKECKMAQEVSGYENTFKRLYLNIWTEQDVRWLRMDAWQKCKALFSETDFHKLPCYIGLDLSSTTDVTAMVLLFQKNEIIFSIPYFFVPKDNVELRVKKDKVPYDQWIRKKHIIGTEGSAVDYAYIRNKINELDKVFNIKEIAVDRWNAHYLVTQLEQDGFTCVAVPQNFANLSSPTKELGKLVVTDKFKHNGNYCYDWMASNVAVDQDANGNIKFSKKKSMERIDGLAATINALSRLIVSKNKPTSIYLKRGLLSV